MAINRKTPAVIELEHHMLDHCTTDALRDELSNYFCRYPFSVVDEIVVAVVAVAGIVAWPWISELLSDRVLMFTVGFVVAAGAILWSLLSVNTT